MGSGNARDLQQLQAGNVQLTQHTGDGCSCRQLLLLSKGSVTIQEDQRVGGF